MAEIAAAGFLLQDKPALGGHAAEEDNVSPFDNTQLSDC